MQYTTFAAIDIGSYELSMKIFELSSKMGMREIDHIRHRIELGMDTYRSGRISHDLVEELCEVLQDFKRIMGEYKVSDYRICATSAIRETKNTILVLDQIRTRTGFDTEVLSNSEQRFLGYKSIASKETNFRSIIQKGTAIIDVGGGSIQISLFDRDSLQSTHNLRFGTLRIRERLAALEGSSLRYGDIVEEMINTDIYNFRRLYQKEQKIENIIIVGEFINQMIQRITKDTQEHFVTCENFMKFCDDAGEQAPEQIAQELGVPAENSAMILPALVIYRRLVTELGADYIWAPGVELTDGIAYHYAEQNKIIKFQHNFDNDILAAAKNIGKRYMCNKTHIAVVSELAMIVFDSTKKLHGMGKRERLLLQIAVLLHDCGKYISLVKVAECSYSIIMSTEIIGLSHKEREIIANVVRYNTLDFETFDNIVDKDQLDVGSYQTMAKLVAILRVANALDRSHKQKFKNCKAALKEKELIITVNTVDDISLECELFPEKAGFFEEVFGIQPKIKQKKKI